MNRILASGILLWIGTALAAPPADIDAYVAKTMDVFGPPGLSLSIVEDGKTVLAKGYGIRELNGKARTDEHTLFPIGSCTKAFTSAALALLVDDKKLGWDDKLIDHMPWFRMYDPYTTAEMTVRDSLVHRSGLGLGAGDLLWLGGSTYSRKQVIQRLRYIKPATSFRSGYAYDNVLYAAAGQLVEDVSGMSWEKFTEKRLFAPLGMKDSMVAHGASQKVRNRASLHARLQGELRGMGPIEVLRNGENALESGNTSPAGSIYSSAADMGEWMKVQLGQGVMANGKRLWSEAQAREMWTGVVAEPVGKVPPVPMFRLYALGWNVEDYRGQKIITHTGGVLGGAAIVVLVPEKKIGISAMVNSEDGAARRALAYHLLDHYLGLSQEDWIGSYKALIDKMQAGGVAMLKSLPAEPQAGGGPGPSLPLEKYAGTYKDAWYGNITISKAGDKLRLQFDHTPSLKGALEHVRYDTFRTRFDDKTFEDAYVTFALKPDGSIDQAKMKAVSPLADFSFNYHDLLLIPVKQEK